MPTYQFQCEDCGHITEVFCEIKHRKNKISCERCCKNAKRLYTIGGAFIKKRRVSDIWDEAGIDTGEGETIGRKQRNIERIQKMREKNTDNGDKK